MSHLRMPEGGSASNFGAACKEGSIPQLPPLAIHSMTQQQLQEFITCLTPLLAQWTSPGTAAGGLSPSESKALALKTSTAEACLSTTSMAQKAVVVQSLREAVSGCYRFLGQEGQLWDSCPNLDWKSWLKSTGSLLADKGLPDFPASRKLSMWPPGQATTPVKSFVAVYLCIHCDAEFSTKEQLKQHQVLCTMQPQSNMDHAPPTPPASSVSGGTRSKGRRLKRLQINLPTSSSSSSSTAASSSSATSTSTSAASTPNKTPSKKDFMERMGLIPKDSLASVKARRSGEVACEKLDLAEPQTPISPTSPRTPRLLITQVSREGEVCPVSKRRLSYLQPPQAHASDAESTGSEESEIVPAVRSLLSIDFSSLLGLRVAKHLKQEDNSVHLVRDPEAHCHTPVKNHFLEKLRNRTEAYSTTFRPTRKRLRQHNHVYKFTKRQRKEFMDWMNTGLNLRSRKLLSCIPKSYVKVYRLNKAELDRWLPPRRNLCVCLTAISESDIVHWCSPKAKEEGTSIFPGTSLLEDANMEQYLGLRCTRVRGDKPIKQLQQSMSHLVSEDENAEAVGLRQAVFHSCLSDASHSRSPSPASSLGKSGRACMRGLSRTSMRPGLQDPLVINIPPHTYSPSSLLSECSGNRSSDDSISILTVSSSDECCAKNSECCSGCRQRLEMKPSPLPSPLTQFLKMEEGNTDSGSPSKTRRQSSPGGPGLRVGGLSPGGLSAAGAYSLRSQDFKTRSGQPWGQLEQSPRKRGMSQSEQAPKLTISSSVPTLVSMLSRPRDSAEGSPWSDRASSPRKRKLSSSISPAALAGDQAVAPESVLQKSRTEDQGVVGTRRQLLGSPQKTKSQVELVTSQESQLRPKLLSVHSPAKRPSISGKTSESSTRHALTKARSSPAGRIKKKVSWRKCSNAGFLNPGSYKRSRGRRRKPPALQPVTSSPASSSTARASAVTGSAVPDGPPKLEKMTDSPSKTRPT